MIPAAVLAVGILSFAVLAAVLTQDLVSARTQNRRLRVLTFVGTAIVVAVFGTMIVYSIAHEALGLP